MNQTTQTIEQAAKRLSTRYSEYNLMCQKLVSLNELNAFMDGVRWALQGEPNYDFMGR